MTSSSNVVSNVRFLSCKNCWPQFDLEHSWLEGTKGLPKYGDICTNCHIGIIEYVATGKPILGELPDL